MCNYKFSSGLGQFTPGYFMQFHFLQPCGLEAFNDPFLSHIYDHINTYAFSHKSKILLNFSLNVVLFCLLICLSIYILSQKLLFIVILLWAHPPPSLCRTTLTPGAPRQLRRVCVKGEYDCGNCKMGRKGIKKKSCWWTNPFISFLKNN